MPEFLGIKVRHDFIKDFGGAILHRPQDAEQHPTGDAAPGAILPPCLAFEGFLAFDLALRERAEREAIALGAAPPAGAGQGKTPQEGFIFIQ